MSYDLHAFRLPPGTDPEDALEALEGGAGDPPTGQERDWMRTLGDALAAAVPALERTELDDALELTDHHLQVNVYTDQAAISIPYWFDGEEAQTALAEALACARVLRETGELSVFDPQLDALIEPATPVEQLAEVYAQGREHVRRLGE